MGVIERTREATRILIGRREIIASTVRLSDRWSRNVISTRDDIERANQYNRWVKICTDLTAQAVASRPIRVFREAPALTGKGAWRTRRVTDRERDRFVKMPAHTFQKFADLSDELEEITDPTHPINRLFRTINPFYNGYDFFEQTDSHLSMYGNAFWVPVLGDAGWPVELWSLHPLYTQILPHETRFIDGYMYARDPTEPIIFDQTAVVHHHQKRGVNPDPYRGVGNLDAVLLESDLSRLISVHQYSSLERGNQPGLTVTGPGVTADNKNEIVALIDQQGGPEGAGRSMAFVGEVTVAQWQQLEKEMSYLQTGKDVRDMIAAAWQLPIAMLTSEDVNLANGKVAAPHWQLISIGPRTRRMGDKINEQVIPLFEAPLGQKFCVLIDEPELGDETAASEGERANWRDGLTFRGETRAALGLDDIDDGEQVFFADTQPALPEPGGGLGGLFGFNTPAPLQLENVNEPRQLDNTRNSQHDRVHDRAGSARNTRSVANAWPFADDHEGCGEDWPKDFKRIEGAREIVASEQQLIAALTRWFGGITGSIDPNRGSFTAELSEWPDDVRSEVDRLFLLGINAAQRELGKEAVAQLSDAAVAHLRANESTLIESLTQSVNERVSSALQQSIEAGVPITETTASVREALGPDSTQAAAERIARTETSNAYIEGRIQQYEADPDVIGKEWLLSSDPCPICLAIHKTNKTVGIRENFTSPLGKGSFSSIKRAPAHPQCRCDVRAVRTEV